MPCFLFVGVRSGERIELSILSLVPSLLFLVLFESYAALLSAAALERCTLRPALLGIVQGLLVLGPGA